MQKYILCGIDAHEKTLVTRMAVGKAKAVTGRYANSPSGWAALEKGLTQLAAGVSGVEMVVAYEASSLGFGLYDHFTSRGMSCHVLAPHKIRQSAEDRKKKEDVRDAQRVLEELKNHYLAGSELPAVWVPDEQTRQDRQLVRARFELGEKVTEIKTQIRMFLKVNGLRVEYSTKKAWTQAYRRGLKRLSEQPERLEESLRLVLACYLRLLESFEAEQRHLEEAIGRLSQTPRYAVRVRKLVDEVCGVGLLTAMVFLTELGSLERFANRRQIAAYLGLSPSSHESGESNDRKGHITGYGPFRVRKVLCQSVWCQVRNVAQEAPAYRRIVARNPKKKKIAVVACMRRLAIRMWHIGRDAQPPGREALRSAA